jgi:transcriptional regulator with XRE-family HTH domain
MTQQQLAVASGVVDATLRAVERGAKTPHRATLLAIASALDVAVEDLMAAADRAARRN